MIGTTHFLVGAALGSFISLPAAGVAAVSSLVPDLDTPGSTLGRLAFPVSALLNAALGHRSVLHSAIGLGIYAALFQVFAPKFLLAALIGYGSHLLLDALNPKGIFPLWPLPLKLSIPLVKAGGVLEKIIFWPLAFAVFYFSLKGVI